jgi:ATP-dependent Clp protease ATP-binding subunit ClpX
MLKDLIIAANNDIGQAKNGIIYIDEIDKLAAFGENSHRESYSKGVQQGLLKIIEGGVIPIRYDQPGQSYTINFDTSNVLFIVGGAFNGIKEEQSEQKSIGFSSDIQTKVSETTIEQKDFVKYGMTQEFMGRFPVVVQLNKLNEDEIYRIMIEPKNSIISQYKKLVNCIGAELIFEEELLRAIAQNAIKSNTGARGLRTVIEKLVEDVMYELPDKENIKKVVMHNGILNGQKPTYLDK